MLFAKRWVRRAVHLFVLALPLFLAAPVLGQEPTKEELKRQIQELQRQQCEVPEFKVEWFSSHGAVLVAKARPNLSFKTIQILPTSVGEGEVMDPVFSYDSGADKAFIATEDGTRRNIPFNGKVGRKSLDRIRAQNGWVAIQYEAEDEECALRRSGEIVQPILERHKLSIDAGTVLALEEEGGWNSQLEVAVVAESKWWDWLTGYVDLRYSYIGASEDTNGDGDDDGDDTGDEAEEEPTQEEEQISNPFESGGGSFRGNLSLGIHPLRTPSFAVVGGVGFSTAPDSENLRAEIRYFTALRFQVFAYNVQQAPDFFGNTSGFVQFGYAQDDLWEWDEEIPAVAPSTEPTLVHRDESERWFVEAQLKLPSNGNLMSFSPRIYADIPVSGDGPSDVRISILAKLNLQNFVGFFGSGSQ